MRIPHCSLDQLGSLNTSVFIWVKISNPDSLTTIGYLGVLFDKALANSLENVTIFTFCIKRNAPTHIDRLYSIHEYIIIYLFVVAN